VQAGPTASLADLFIVNLLSLQVIERLAAAQSGGATGGPADEARDGRAAKPLPVLRSNHMPGGAEQNDELLAAYRDKLLDSTLSLKESQVRILYIDIDSLRPDHLGCYGYHRNTSPNIDELARTATRFDNYYVSDAPCLPSRTALWSGRCGFRNGVVSQAVPPPSRSAKARSGTSSTSSGRAAGWRP
jgi:hypothetical protein